jgi:hypothetical protein
MVEAPVAAVQHLRTLKASRPSSYARCEDGPSGLTCSRQLTGDVVRVEFRVESAGPPTRAWPSPAALVTYVERRGRVFADDQILRTLVHAAKPGLPGAEVADQILWVVLTPTLFELAAHFVSRPENVSEMEDVVGVLMERASGWKRLIGRPPTDDDLIVPFGETDESIQCHRTLKDRRRKLFGEHIDNKVMLARFQADLATLGARPRRQHDAAGPSSPVARRRGALGHYTSLIWRPSAMRSRSSGSSSAGLKTWSRSRPLTCRNHMVRTVSLLHRQRRLPDSL